MEIKTFFDARTWTLTYVVHDPETLDAVIIDPVLDYDPASGRIWTESLDQVHTFVREADRNGVLRQAVDEIGGAVQRVDDPLVVVVCTGAGQARLLC